MWFEISHHAGILGKLADLRIIVDHGGVLDLLLVKSLRVPVVLIFFNVLKRFRESLVVIGLMIDDSIFCHRILVVLFFLFSSKLFLLDDSIEHVGLHALQHSAKRRLVPFRRVTAQSKQHPSQLSARRHFAGAHLSQLVTICFLRVEELGFVFLAFQNTTHCKLWHLLVLRLQVSEWVDDSGGSISGCRNLLVDVHDS